MQMHRHFTACLLEKIEKMELRVCKGPVAHQSKQEGKSHDEGLWGEESLLPPDDEAACGEVLARWSSLGDLSHGHASQSLLRDSPGHSWAIPIHFECLP